MFYTRRAGAIEDGAFGGLAVVLDVVAGEQSRWPFGMYPFGVSETTYYSILAFGPHVLSLFLML